MRALTWHGNHDVRVETDARSRDRQPARRDHRDHLDRDLRLRPAPLRRRDPRHDGRATSSATSSWAASSRSGRRARSRRASGWSCPSRSPAAAASSARSSSSRPATTPTRSPSRTLTEPLYGHAMSGLFGYSHLTGGYPGGQAEYVRVPFSDVGPIVIPTTCSTTSRCCSSPTSCRPAGWRPRTPTSSEGDTVAVWGCGPVGLFAVQSALLMGAARVIAIDHYPHRLELARGARRRDHRLRADQRCSRR